jgi:hypothetical protein
MFLFLAIHPQIGKSKIVDLILSIMEEHYGKAK